MISTNAQNYTAEVRITGTYTEVAVTLNVGSIFLSDGTHEVQTKTMVSAVQLVDTASGIDLYWVASGDLYKARLESDLSLSGTTLLVGAGPVAGFFVRDLPGVGAAYAYVVGTVLKINIAGNVFTGTWGADRQPEFTFDVSNDLHTVSVLYRAGEPSQAFIESYSAMVKAEAPVFTPGAGTYQGIQSVIISSNTAGAVIHYTVDGSTPTDASPVASAAVSVSESMTLRAIAVAAGYVNSDVSDAAYVIVLAPMAVAPVFTPVAGAYTTAITVAITSTTPNKIIRYTLDGSAPTMSSPIYYNPIAVSADVTIRAFATAAGYRPSLVSTAAYTINIAPPTPEEHVNPVYSMLKLYDFKMGLREVSEFAQDYSV